MSVTDWYDDFCAQSGVRVGVITVALATLELKAVLQAGFTNDDQYCWSLKPIFHQNQHSRWLPNANNIDANNMKYTWPTRIQSLHWSGALRWVLGPVGRGKADSSCWWSKPLRGSNVSGFALQWNIHPSHDPRSDLS